MRALFTCLFGLSCATVANGQQLAWSSSFDAGFPGEWLNYNDGSFSPNGAMPAGRVSAWSIVSSDNGVSPLHGGHMYKGWIVGSSGASHRAYPSLHLDVPTPLVNTFMVYLDIDYARLSSSDWVHFGTWGNVGAWGLHTMSVRDRKLVFAHTDPFEGEYIGPQPRADFPLRRWVRMTMYLHYQGATGTAQVWQDGVPMLRARVSQLQRANGTNLQRAHWGMYAAGTVDHGVQYNDRIEICRLSAPLTDLSKEPTCGTSVRPNPPTGLRAE